MSFYPNLIPNMQKIIVPFWRTLQSTIVAKLMARFNLHALTVNFNKINVQTLKVGVGEISLLYNSESTPG